MRIKGEIKGIFIIFSGLLVTKNGLRRGSDTIKTYIEATETELKQHGDSSNNKGYNNLFKDERITLKELSDHTDIIISQADKQGAAIVMGVKHYVDEAHSQLNYKDHYKKLNKDPATTNAKLVDDTIQRFKKAKLLKEKIADRLKVSNPKTPEFYMQPKIRNKDNSG